MLVNVPSFSAQAAAQKAAWICEAAGNRIDKLVARVKELGMNAVEDKVHMHDLHATILHQLGLNHDKLTFRYNGRDFRLTDVHGHVVKDILA